MIAKKWNFAKTQDSTWVSLKSIPLSGDPLFLHPVPPETSVPSGTDPLLTTVKPIKIDYYPNPVQSTLNLSMELPQSADVFVEIVNNHGQVMHRVLDGKHLQKGRHNWQIPVQNWLPGVYHLRYKTNQRTGVQRLPLTKLR